MFRSDHLYEIKFKKHVIQINIFDGRIIENEAVLYNFKKPEYIPETKCERFETILKKCFELSNEPQKLLNYFWEFVGYYFIYEQKQNQWIMQGNDSTGKHEIIDIINSVFMIKFKKTNILFDGDFVTHYKVKNNPKKTSINLIPFYGNHAVNLSPVQLNNIIAMERNGITLSALKGLQRVFKNQKFTELNEVNEAKKTYLEIENDVQLFIKEKLTRLENSKIKTQDEILYQAYLNWHKSDKTKIKNMRTFNNYMKAEKFLLLAGKKRYFKNVVLNDN